MLKMSDLEGIADTRRGQGRMYDLPHVLLCCILAVTAGADSYRSIVRFVDTRLEWLREHTGLAWRRAPTHTGLRAILLGLDQAAVERALRRRSAQALAGAARGDMVTVAIDSKALRGSLDRFADKAALQWLSAFATGPRLVLGQVGWDSGAKGGETRRRAGSDRVSRSPGQALHARRAALSKKLCKSPSPAAVTLWYRSRATSRRCCKTSRPWPLRRSRRVHTTRTSSASVTASRRAAPRCGRWTPGGWASSGQPLPA